MSDARETAIAAVAADLATVSTGNGYNYTFAAVHRDVRPPTDCPLKPAICIVELGERVERAASPRERFLITQLMLLVYLERTDFSVSISTMLNLALADLKRIMVGTTTWTHGNTVLRTLYDGCDPLGAAAQANVCSLSATFSLHYAEGWEGQAL